ncbi:MAG: class I SAM-dependent methyltransferase [Dehalococcoidia bacterium]
MNPVNSPTDFVGYENLIAFLQERDICKLDGDLIEIGAFMGGGTVKLAEFAACYGKRVYVIDIFEPALDQTMSRSGITASEVYEAFLEGKSMYDVYSNAVKDFSNVETIRKDSKIVHFDQTQRFVFGFVDGCHQEAYVLNDFHLIWPHLVSGGVIGFHDYGYDDWPEVTRAVDKLLGSHKEEISESVEVEGVYGIRSLLLVKV